MIYFTWKSAIINKLYENVQLCVNKYNISSLLFAYIYIYSPNLLPVKMGVFYMKMQQNFKL